MVEPAHNHAENYENLQELTLWMGTGFTRPHGGRLMILPVDQNVGTCLVKGSTCAPLQTSVLLQIQSYTCLASSRTRAIIWSLLDLGAASDSLLAKLLMHGTAQCIANLGARSLLELAS